MPDRHRVDRRRPATVQPLEWRCLLSTGSGVLSGSNDYAGATTVSAGTLQITSGGSVGGTSSSVLTLTGGNPAGTSPTPTTATLGGQVYVDQLRLGFPNEDDPPASGQVVSLDADGDGVADATTTADADGNYSFTGLAPGTYTVRLAAVPAGDGLTEPVAGSYTRAVVAGSDDAGLHFGLAPAGAAAGTVFDDANANGLVDATEPGAAGITVRATPQGDGNYRYAYQTTTDANGSYAFPALPAGTYTVAADDGNLWFASAPFGTADTITVPAAGSATAAPLGLAPIAAAATVTGTVFADLDGDGVQAPTEPGHYGALVYLDLDGDGLAGAAEPRETVDTDGRFAFDDLPPGTYTVGVEPPAYNDLAVTSLTADTVVASAGQTVRAAPLGVGPQPVAGTVRSADGSPRAGATVYLDANANGRLDPGETTTVTAPDGTYRFNDLPTGSYRVDQLIPLGETAVATHGAADDAHTADVGDGSSTVGNDFATAPLQAGPLTAAIVTRPTRAATAGSRGTVRVRLTNAGRTVFAGAVPVAVYVSADGSVSTQDVADGQVSRSVHLAGGRSAVVAVPVTYPADGVGGDYHLVAAATTAAADAPALASVAVTADLSPAIVAPAAGVALRPGVPAVVVVRLANRGTVAATGSAAVVVGAVATDGTVESIGSTTATRLRVPAGRSALVRVTVTPPAGRTVGSYRLVSALTAVTSPADDDPTDDTSPAVATR